MKITPPVLYWLHRFQGWDYSGGTEPTTLSLFKYIYCYENSIPLPEPRQYRESLHYQMSQMPWGKFLAQLKMDEFPESNKFFPPNGSAVKAILGPAAHFAVVAKTAGAQNKEELALETAKRAKEAKAKARKLKKKKKK